MTDLMRYALLMFAKVATNEIFLPYFFSFFKKERNQLETGKIDDGENKRIKLIKLTKLKARW